MNKSIHLDTNDQALFLNCDLRHRNQMLEVEDAP